MLFYIKCPSCSEIISQDLDKYYQDKDEIFNNPKLTNKQKDEMDAKLLDKYGYTKLCCRQRVKTAIPYHKIVVT